MRRRAFFLTSAALFAACALPRERMRRRPNIVLIMADDLGYADVGFTGRTDYATPAIDSIARAGMVLDQAYSAAPVCTPTRVALATGRYPARDPVGLYEPLTSQRDLGLRTTPPTLGMLLSDAGYDTALVGKWHLGLAPEAHPLEHGYDHFYGFLGSAIDYRSLEDTALRERVFYDDRAPVEPGPYATDLFTERAVAYIAEERDAPFFLNLQYNAPHWPWQGPDDPVHADADARSGGSAQTFAGMVTSMDAGVGRVLEALRARGIERDTLVVFTSDNGGERFSHMGPFSEGKMTLHEGGIRVAAAARWPGVIPASSRSAQVSVTMDWTATFAALAGVQPDAHATFDGIDLMPTLRGATATRPRDLYWRIFQRRRQKAARSGDSKYLVTAEGEFLFDLAADPGEQNDLRTVRPDEFRRIRSLYAAWERDVLEPIPLDTAHD